MKKQTTALLLLLVFSVLRGSAQTTFPDRCLGTWTGTMLIYSQGIVKDSVQVRMTVAKSSEPAAWTWKTEYLSPKMPVTKDYVLRLKDAAKNLYVNDERNGILLDTYLAGSKLYNVFEVSGILLTSSYELVGDRLVFEVTSGKKGGETGEGVVNYSVANVQRVVLRRISN